MLESRAIDSLKQFKESVNNKNREDIYKRGGLFYADLGEVDRNAKDCEQKGERPVIIIQNDIGNKYSPTVIVAAITSQISKAKLPTHVEISASEYGLTKDSVILCEQVRTLDKKKLKWYIGELSETDMNNVDKATLISLDLVKKIEDLKQKLHFEQQRQKHEAIIANKVGEITSLDSSIKRCLDNNIGLDHPYLQKTLEERLTQIDYLRGICKNIGIEINDVYDMNVGVINNELRGVCCI